MNVLHWMKKEDSGLVRSTLELVKYEEKAGHKVCVKQPGEDMPLYGHENGVDIHCIHSQLHPKAYYDKKPKIMMMHGEPLGSVANGISMKAIIELAPLVDAFVCMREEEQAIWNSIKRTYRIPKGIDLEVYKPIKGYTEKLSGEPAVLYIENWRRERNPLYLCVAMIEVFKKFPNARLHLYNVRDKRMAEVFQMLINHNKWGTFVRTISGPVKDVNELYNKVDIVVSCLYPLYARGIEAFGAGKAFIGAGYREYNYPYMCNLNPHSMARAIIKCWSEYGKMDFREWAKKHHNIEDSVKELIDIYRRYL